MKNTSPLNNWAGPQRAANSILGGQKFCRQKFARSAAASALLAMILLAPFSASRAQRRKDGPVTVAGMTTRKTASGTVLTIAADAPLKRIQTWQDGDKFHLIVPDAGQSVVKSRARGVVVNRVSKSLEIIVKIKPGSNVTVQPNFNRLNLIVSGEIDTAPGGSDDDASTAQTTRHAERAADASSTALASRLPRERRSTASETQTATSASASSAISDSASSGHQNSGASSTTAARASSAAGNPTTIIPTQGERNLAPANGPVANSVSQDSVTSSVVVREEQTGGIFSTIFSYTGITIILVLGLGALFIVRHRNSSAGEMAEVSSRRETKTLTTATGAAITSAADTLPTETKERRRDERRKMGRRSMDQKLKAASSSPEAGNSGGEQTEARSAAAVAAPLALFGAYRVDQEVGKLLLGQPHRTDVLASRAHDDRRAIEASLTKAMNAPDVDESERRRAREALVEYGFVARISATMLLASDAYERTSAARTLGEIGSPTALPFLLEALCDAETSVRTQAVQSLGALKIPAAIGALLDLARRHPEMSPALLSRTLTACSIESLEGFGEADGADGALLSHATSSAPFTGEITQLEPATAVEELPEWIEDEVLTNALAQLGEQDAETRSAAARVLAQYQVQRAVEALADLAARDEEAAVRATAVASLGAIDHDSVFAPVLIALTDEAREVRAAAARSLSRLNFDRADAYVRVIEKADADTLRNVAQACVKAGMASQAVDRLASDDRRQVYEAFSLLSLLAKSNETELLLEAVNNHTDMNVRLSVLRLLGLSGQPEVGQKLRHLAVRDDVPEKVRGAVLEVVYKMDQAQPV